MVEASSELTLGGGRYRLDQVRRRGPHGVVFTATDLHEGHARHTGPGGGRPCAVKRLYPHLQDPARIEAMLREAADAACLSHPAVLAPWDSGYDDDGALFLVSDLHPGESLRSRLRRGPLTPAEALAVLGPVCEALELAHHAGLPHGDLTPENILVPRDGQGQVQVCDFGMHQLAAIAGPGAAPVDGAGYLPPEVYRGELPRASAETDQFALGALIYECLHARPLFEASDAAALLFKICMAPLPPASTLALTPTQRQRLEAIIAMACKRGQAVRFDGVAALMRALRAVLEDRPPTPADLAPEAPAPAGPSQPVAASAVTVPRRDTRDSWRRAEGSVASSHDEGPSPATPPVGIAPVALAPRWGSLALWASAGGLVMALALLALRLSNDGRRAAAAATAQAQAAQARSGAEPLAAAQARVAARDYAGALGELEALARRADVTPEQRQAAQALQRTAAEGLKQGLLFRGFTSAAERGEIETAVALFQEMPAGSPQRAQALPLYAALRRRFQDAHLALAQSALAAGRCDEVARQVEQLRRTAEAPSDPALTEALALLGGCPGSPGAAGAGSQPTPEAVSARPAPPEGTPGAARRGGRRGRSLELKNPFD